MHVIIVTRVRLVSLWLSVILFLESLFELIDLLLSSVKARLLRAKTFAFFCMFQGRRRLVSMGDANANARCKRAFMFD